MNSITRNVRQVNQVVTLEPSENDIYRQVYRPQLSESAVARAKDVTQDFLAPEGFNGPL